jgi:hypothetical protein
MHIAPAPSLQPRDDTRRLRPLAAEAAHGQRRILAVERIGYLVPTADFDGAVHGVYARACNIAWEGSLLTLVAPGPADGPTTLRLGHDARSDLRALFRVGDRVLRRGAIVQARSATLHLADAPIWRPAPPQPRVPRSQIAANLRIAGAALRRHRHRHSSVIDRAAGMVRAALEESCRELDVARALPPIERLVGWGEGLTPAGDDFLVGWCAALDALAGGHELRVRFARDIGAAIAARTGRTTPIAAHCLRLATQGHFDAGMHGLRDALLCGHDVARLHGALASALAVGSTSGADTVTGLLSGCDAWL